MNLKKLVEMSRDENPNPNLVFLSIQWAGKNEDNNPVTHAQSLSRWRKFLWVFILWGLVWALITIAWKMSDNTAIHNTKVFWLVLGVIPFGLIFVGWMSKWDNGEFYEDRNALAFIEAITILEGLIGKPFEEWTAENDLKKIATEHLIKSADDVKSTDLDRKGQIARIPWKTPSSDAEWKRRVFDYHHGLLTKLIPELPKKKGFYYGNNDSDAETGEGE